ncbi:hypothetical protein GDO78_013410 [Eleutherodactylus coqui]|uniref:Integrator complex subunit 6-like n=2 Tax=Eleutherodactylus coqui TaxID=57060 RepID=A0A8J6K7J2_ELECQ|nr:hypothetical protein GDO78_013410 [Eleutherodactylus coqui]KAG9478385.1 hypothetical protein GDO78_013410 [Eleutherodactylus coqui]
MPILLFLIDTSASMNQRTYLGTTYLDIAKGAVEIFMKLRARDPASRGDRYMLVTYDEPPYCIKGRNPFFLEPSILITITDGNKLTVPSGVLEELHLPLNSPLPGSELTKEPFRWDQRLFALVLRLPGALSVEPEQVGSVPSDESAITQMCEVTGGRSYCVRTQRMLNQCLESLVQKVQSGVVINFEKTGPDPTPNGEDVLPDSVRPVNSFAPQAWHSCHKLIYVRPNPKTGVPVGHWPIPESFWPDQNSPTLPPRTSHPVVKFSCVDCDPMVIDKLPFDKYELEPSPLTQYILERKSFHTCWQVFVGSSGKYSEIGQPFGYLKASTTLTCVNLFVMPYNYPVLLPLLDDLFKLHKLKPTLKWRQSFDNYLKTMPPYFLMPLKKALRMMGAPNLISDNLDCGLSYSVISYLKKLSQQTKIESERIIASVGKKVPQETGIKVKNNSTRLSLVHNRHFKQLLQGISGESPIRLLEMNVKEFPGFQIGLLNKDLKPQAYRNAYDIPRRNLLDQLTRMRTNLLKTHKLIVGQDEDCLHSVPVSQMGNYQEYLKLMPSPLREIDPDQPKRLHTFGNPFKQDKKVLFLKSKYGNNSVATEGNGERTDNGQALDKSLDGLSPLIVPAALGDEDMLPNNFDSVTDELNCLNEDSLDHKPINNTLLKAPLENYVHLQDSLMTRECTSGMTVPNSLKEMQSIINGTNADIKIRVMKEVRKPGRNYEKIFALLEEVQGPSEIQKTFIEFTIKEAARFKKRVLIQHLERFLSELDPNGVPNIVNHVNSR